MLTKNLNSSFSHWMFWCLISTLALGGGLLNAWMGFPLPTPFEGIYSAIGGVIPYSDAEAYLTGAHQFIESGFLDPWNMRRPLNTLLLAFYLKMTNLNFWYVMVLQMGACVIALSFFLKTIRQDLGILAAFVSLVFLNYYAQTYIHTTLSEILGLTLGLFSFVLLWNGWIHRNRFIFNAGMASLAIALNARAGPNFMVFGLLFLIYFEPFAQSRLRDLTYCVLSFGLSFYAMTKLSTVFGTPGTGMVFSNFGPTLYGLVSGGNGWLYAFNDPNIQSLINGKDEAQQSIILYQESWKVFKNNPVHLIIGMGKYSGDFFVWFFRRLVFGEGAVKLVTTITAVLFWVFISFQLMTKRYLFNREFRFLSVVFLSIAASSMITFKDGGIRTFAVAIPFMGAFLGFAFATAPSFIKQRTAANTFSCLGVVFIVMASIIAHSIPINMKRADISEQLQNQLLGQETFVIRNLNHHPYLRIGTSAGFHFRTITSETIRNASTIYSWSDDTLAKDLMNVVNLFTNNNLVLLNIYDYISHSSKWVVAENHILNLNAKWLAIHAIKFTKDFKRIYVSNSFTEIPY